MQSLKKLTPKLISIAPMMGWTNPSMQNLINVIAPSMIFYSQMYHVGAIIHQNIHPTYQTNRLVFQLGGSCPENFFKAGKILKNIGIKKININVGCPSNKVQKGNFGACLMKDPELVSDCLNALTDLYEPSQLSVKCRLGVDYDDSESFLHNFISTIHNITDVNTFIIHARKAWLTGLNPKQNRNIPPLNYKRVYQLKEIYPDFHIGINGGIESIDDILEHSKKCDEIMIGRIVLNDLYHIHIIDSFLNESKPLDRVRLLEKLNLYDCSMNRVLQSLFKGLPGCKQWKKMLPEVVTQKELIELSNQVMLFAAQKVG